MKKIILTLALLLSISALAFAQCDKKVALTSSKTEHLAASGAVQRTEDETAKIEINKSDLVITVNEEHKMTGTIKSDSCNWSVPFKTGKTIIKATLNDGQGEAKNITLTITGKDGKVTLLFEMEGMPDDRIKVGIDKFEEVM